MVLQNIKILRILILLFLSTQLVWSQVNFNKRPDDDLGNVEDEFQEYFYEALKQKGIENYQKAVDALQKCLNLNSDEAIVYFELGKNYNKLKNFGAAEDYLKKAIDMQPDNQWFLDELYDVYHQQGDTNKALKTVKQLVDYHPDYREDLAALYVKEERYKQALEILDELDAQFGVTDSRQQMRSDIYSITGNLDDRIAYLEERIQQEPNIEDNHLKLIYRYSQIGEKKKAFKAAKNLLKIKPESYLVHLALYKFYLDDNAVSKAVNSMKIVLKNPQISAEAKTKVVKDFVVFVAQNPEYEKDLVDITTIADEDKSAKTHAELGAYYLKAGDKVKALYNFKQALKQEPDNFKYIKDVVLLQIDVEDYEAAMTSINEALELYPVQPIFYLMKGVTQNRLKAYNEAEQSLETGLEFLIDNPKMEADFYSELSITHKGLDNIKKSQAFAKKAHALKSKE